MYNEVRVILDEGVFISVFHILDLDFLFDHQASHKLLPVVKHLKHRRSNLNSFRFEFRLTRFSLFSSSRLS